MTTEQHIFEADGGPTTPPLHVGAHWVDKATGEVFISSGIASVLDWGEPVNKRRPPRLRIRTIPKPADGYVGVVIDELHTDDELVRAMSFLHDHVIFIKRQEATKFDIGRVVTVRHTYGNIDGLRIAVNPGDEDRILLNVYLPVDFSIAPGEKSSINVAPGGAVSLVYIGLDSLGRETWDIDGDYTVQGVDAGV